MGNLFENELSCLFILSESTGQLLLLEQVPLGTGHTMEVAQKPVSL
jgi:hypothetical protein